MPKLALQIDQNARSVPYYHRLFVSRKWTGWFVKQLQGLKRDYWRCLEEEFTAEQGVELDQEIARVQKENKARVAREGKERRKKWAQNITPRPSKGTKKAQDVTEEAETHHESSTRAGMLPNEIVEMLAAREKQVFSSDSEDENAESKHAERKKKLKSSGIEPIILKDARPAQCSQNSLEFLTKRKMQVPRSSSVLNNSNQALRLLTASGLLRKT